jgi:hypothetical protein
MPNLVRFSGKICFIILNSRHTIKLNLDESCPRQLSLEAVLKLYLFYWFHLTDFDCYITNSYENPCLRTGSFMFVTYADEHLFHAMVYYIHVPLIILLYYVGTGPLHDKSNLRRASLSCLGQLSSKFTTVFIILACTVRRRHPHSKVRECFIGYALHSEEDMSNAFSHSKHNF